MVHGDFIKKRKGKRTIEKKKHRKTIFSFSGVELIPRKWYTYTPIFPQKKEGLVNANGTAGFSFITVRNKGFSSLETM